MGQIDREYKFVQLQRTFYELSKFAHENDDSDLSQAFQVGERLGWADLQRDHRVVILSEAGSGKTQEIRETAKRLRSEGKSAFFLRLD